MTREKGVNEITGSHGFFARPHGAPRGLLLYYMLHRIAIKPSHGYELLQDIEGKTEGVWRPGAGSIYPILKKLVSEGLIKSDGGKNSRTALRVYHITAEGEKRLREGKKMFASSGQRWSAMRRIFVDMIDPEDIGKYLVEGSKLHFQITQEMLESKMNKIPPSEVEFMLKEWALNLERQLDWTNRILKELRGKTIQFASQRSR